MARHPKTNGFTLVEILIALSIIAILVIIAFPSTQELQQSSHRSEATLLLTKLQFQQEQWLSKNKQYGQLTDLKQSSISENEWYQIKMKLLENDNYLITAKPINSQLGDTCGTYAMDKFGPVISAGSYASLDCWQL